MVEKKPSELEKKHNSSSNQNRSLMIFTFPSVSLKTYYVLFDE